MIRVFDLCLAISFAFIIDCGLLCGGSRTRLYSDGNQSNGDTGE